MTVEANITREAGYEWHIYDAKHIDIRVRDAAGEPVDLTSIDMLFRVSRDDIGSRVYLTKTPTAVAHADDDGDVKSIARIAVEHDDYDASPGPGFYRHELRDLTAQLVLCRGDVELLPAMPLPEVP